MIRLTKATIRLGTGMKPLDIRCHGKVSLLFVFLLLSLVLATVTAVYLLAPNNPQNAVSSQTQNNLSTNLGDLNAIQQDSTNLQQTNKTTFLSKLFSKQKNQTVAGQDLAPQQTPASPEYLQNTYQSLYYEQFQNIDQQNLPSISGRVLSPEGHPLKDVVITASLREYFKSSVIDTPKPKPQALTATSNASGFFAFRDLDDGIYLLVSNSNKRYLPKRLEVRTGVKYADLVLTELQNLQLQGLVIDARSGRPIANVHLTPMVKGVPKSAKTDAEGNFTLDFALGERAQIALRVQKQGYRKARFTVDANDWESHQSLVVEIDEASAHGELFGQVKGKGYEYMDGHLVHLYSSSKKVNYKSKTNNVGEFNFKNIEAADDYRLWLRPVTAYQDFSLRGIHVASDIVNQDIQLEALEQGYRLSGQVLDLDNKPVSNTTLALRSMSARNQIVPISTDKFGAFSVENVPGGELIIESRSAPYYTLTGIDLNGDKRSEFHKLVVDRGSHKLLGKVVDAAGDPVAAPKIYITSSQQLNGMRTQASRNTSADVEGKFLFTDLGAQQYTITVNAPGYLGVRVRHNMNSPSQLTVRLDKNPI